MIGQSEGVPNSTEEVRPGEPPPRIDAEVRYTIPQAVNVPPLQWLPLLPLDLDAVLPHVEPFDLAV